MSNLLPRDVHRIEHLAYFLLSLRKARTKIVELGSVLSVLDGVLDRISWSNFLPKEVLWGRGQVIGADYRLTSPYQYVLKKIQNAFFLVTGNSNSNFADAIAQQAEEALERKLKTPKIKKCLRK